MLSEVWDHGCELAVEEGFGYGSTGAFDACEFRVNQTALYVGVEFPTTHVGNGGERAGLHVERAAQAALLGRIGTQFGIHIDFLVIVAESLFSQ